VIQRSVWLMVFGFAVAACSTGDPDDGSSSGGGAASASTSVGSGGGMAGAGGTGAGGAGGQGETACSEVKLGAFILSDTEPGGASLAYDLTGLSADKEHALYIEFYDTAGAQAAGSFDVSKPPDNAYSTCAHCLLAFEDVNGADPIAYYQASGTLKVTSPDISYKGASAGSLDGIKLIEVTIEGTKTTPVPGGKCLSLSGAWEHMP